MVVTDKGWINVRKIIEIVAGEMVDLLPHGIDLKKHKITRIWTVFDEERLWNWVKYDPYTGEKVTIKNIEDLHLKHHEGVFLEDYVHDWNIRSKEYLYYYSRVVRQGEKVKILIEYDAL